MWVGSGQGQLQSQGEWQQKQDPPLGSHIRLEASPQHPSPRLKSELYLSSLPCCLTFKHPLDKTRGVSTISAFLYRPRVSGVATENRLGSSSCFAPLFTHTLPAYLRPPPNSLGSCYFQTQNRLLGITRCPPKHLCLPGFFFPHTEGGENPRISLKSGSHLTVCPQIHPSAPSHNPQFSF